MYRSNLIERENLIMGNKIFVGGLSWNINNESLADEFCKYGGVREAKVVTERDTGKSRGFGFVTFENAQSASDAITAMDGREMDGRVIRVNEAKERPPQQRHFG